MNIYSKLFQLFVTNISFYTFMFLVMIVLPARADFFPPSHSCYKPKKPYNFTSQWDVDRFYHDVERYKSCINEFVDAQNNAITNHREAANNAIDEWNNFVRWELKR
jgi:hypothetical protein